MSISRELSGVLADYLSEGMGLDELCDWINANMNPLWDPPVSPTEDERVTAEVYHMMAEMYAGDRLESQIRDYLVGVLRDSEHSAILADRLSYLRQDTSPQR